MRMNFVRSAFAVVALLAGADASAQILVTVTHAGTGAGTTVSDPPGIQCSTAASPCSAGFTNGTMVALTATASPGSTFAGWSGACTGANPCNLIVDSGKAVTATFALLGNVRGDVNGDRKADLFWRQTGTGTGFSWWTMNGAAVLSSNYFDVDPAWQIVDYGDFDGDGNSDIVWRRAADGAMYLWTLAGLAPTGYFDLGIVAPTEWSFAGVADLNGDGKADIVWRRNVDGLIYGWLMNGGTIVGQGVIASNYGPDYYVAELGDITGDGKADLILRRSSDGRGVVVLYMNGVTVTGGTSAPGVGNEWTLLAAADFNGDGKTDWFWHHANGDNYLWFMDGVNVTVVTSIGSTGNASVRAVGDFDGDGKNDIVFRLFDGTTRLWRANGGSFAPGAETITNPGATWRVVGP